MSNTEARQGLSSRRTILNNAINLASPYENANNDHMLKLEILAEIMSQRGVSVTDKFVGFLTATITFFIGMAGVHSFFSEVTTWSLILAGVISSVLGYGAWLLFCRIPRNKSGHIGIGLAIKAETEEERKRIRSDFIAEIASALNRAEAAHPFHVIEIPSYLAPAVNDRKGAVEFLQKSKCHLLIWGGIKTRKNGKKKDVYCLKLESVVTHSHIALKESNALAQEMRFVIPKNTEIEITNELQGFEVASNSLVIATKYIVALASALSGDLNFSKTLLLELVQYLPKPALGKNRGKGAKQKDVALIRRLATILPRRLSDVCYAEYLLLASQWRKDLDNLDLLDAAERSLEMYLVCERKLKTNYESPKYWISKALLEVSLRNNFNGAQNLLLKCKQSVPNDPTWRLSLAFIKIIQANYSEALQLYDTALKLDIDHQTTFDIEHYIQWWLAKHNGPAPLFLLSALLNAFAKSDFAMAKIDLERFEESARLAQVTEKCLFDRAAILRVKLVEQPCEMGLPEDLLPI